MKSTIEVDTLAEILFARLFAYDMLRRVFIEEPSQQYLKHFNQHKMISEFPFSDESAEIKEGVKNIEQYLSEVDVINNNSNFEQLHWDYTKMFIGPFELPVPPWESVYVRGDKLLFQSHTMNVRKQYEHFGFEVSDMNVEADDHIGLELDFMYHLTDLCIQSANAKEENSLAEINYILKAQKDFLTNHLLKFVPRLTDNMKESSTTKFYEGFAQVLNGYLKIDLQVLDELLNNEVVN